MFYHVRVGITGMSSWLEKNLSREKIMNDYVCPYINKEVLCLDERIFNMSSLGNITIYQTDKPIDSDWPISLKDFKGSSDYQYEAAVIKELNNCKKNISYEIFREALVLIENRSYVEYRYKIQEKIKQNNAFYICPLKNRSIIHSYNTIIKPIMKTLGYNIQKADEISHTGKVTDAILKTIRLSRFVIADLTDSRPNCYYEIGYAHSLGKPVLIFAKNKTKMHFDISDYKWNFYKDNRELKKNLSREMTSLIEMFKINPN